MGPLCATSNRGSPVTSLNFQMAPKTKIKIASGFKKKEPRFACPSEAKASHSQRMWAEVSSLTPHALNSGLCQTDSLKRRNVNYSQNKPRLFIQTEFTCFFGCTVKDYNFFCSKKVKWSRNRPGVAQSLSRGTALLFHDRGTRRGWVVSSTPRPHFTPGKHPIAILQEAGWAPGSVWTGGKSRPHRGSIPKCAARSQSLYRLSYPAHILCAV